MGSSNRAHFHWLASAVLVASQVSAQPASPGSSLRELFSTTPKFQTAPMGYFSTGVALEDLNNDSFPDLVLSNGNDRAPQSVVIHLNEGRKITYWPWWYSEDIDYHFDLATGNIDADAQDQVDIVVAVAAGVDRKLRGGGVKVYLNPNPKTSRRPAYVFRGYSALSCALGDIDGDGDLDLAVGTLSEGEASEVLDDSPAPLAPSPRHFQGGRVRIYVNKGHGFDAEPWMAEDSTVTGDVTFADVNQDGWLDLVVAAQQIRVFYGREASLAEVPFKKKPDWTSADLPGEVPGVSFSVEAARLGQGATLSLAVSSQCADPDDTTCYDGFELYRPSAGPEPIWRSAWVSAASSKLALADFNGDGLLDLLASSWGSELMGERLFIFEGTKTGLSESPRFRTETRTIALGVAVADLEGTVPGNKCLMDREFTFIARKRRAVVTLPHHRIEKLKMVERSCSHRPNGCRYARVPGGNWLSVSPPLEPGERLTVRYIVSKAQDFAVANFQGSDPKVGGYVFRSDPKCRSQSSQ